MPTEASLLAALDPLAGVSITAATRDPDKPYAPPPTQTPTVGPDGTEGSLETSTRLAGGHLVSQVIVSFGGTRGVATVNAAICPDEAGKVEGTIRLVIVGADGEEHRSAGIATGSVNDQSALTSSSVASTAKGQAATLLTRYGKQLLKYAESAWRGGYCVKIDVSEGQSGVVKPSAKVPIAARQSRASAPAASKDR